MWRLITAALASALLFVAGCSRHEKTKLELVDDNTPALASIIHVADPRASVQLIKGFHEVEQGAWRWTMGSFAVTLRVPRGGAEKGATLQLKFSLPDTVLQRLKTVTIVANVNGAVLPPQTFSEAGDFVYAQPVPAQALNREAVSVEFTLGKFLPAGSVDQRELGVVVSTIGLEAR